jgi:hypothetical protein
MVSESTEFITGSSVSCSDGPCGELTRVVVDPAARTVTHLVVGPARYPRAPCDSHSARRGSPLGQAAGSHPDRYPAEPAMIRRKAATILVTQTAWHTNLRIRPSCVRIISDGPLLSPD